MDHHVPQPDDFVEAVDGVDLAVGAAGEKTSVQYFTIQQGSEVPEHHHEHEQAGLITAGTLTFVLEGDEEVKVSAGESYVFEGDEVHAAVNESDEIVTGIDVFSPPRTDPAWAE